MGQYFYYILFLMLKIYIVYKSYTRENHYIFCFLARSYYSTSKMRKVRVFAKGFFINRGARPLNH